MNKKHIVWIALITIALLAIPFIGMMVTTGWNWGVFDFVFMGALIFGTGLAFEFIASRGNSRAYRLAVGLGALGSFLLIWVNAAVGLIGEGPINMLYPLVVLLGLIGTFVVRFQPGGMSRIAFTMAGVQILVPVIALLAGSNMAPGALKVFCVSAVFAAIFVASGLLFRKSA